MNKSIVTDSLGFRLEVNIVVDDIEVRGRYKIYTHEDGSIDENTCYTIIINKNLKDELLEVIAHEVYHLFYSIRYLIKVDEETEALVFGQLVNHTYNFAHQYD